MPKSKCCTFEQDPSDYKLSESQLAILFYNKNPDNFEIEVNNEKYSFMRTTSLEKGTQYSMSCKNELRENGFLLRSLFQGDSITIEYDNASFLISASRVLQLKDLEILASSYIKAGRIEPSCKSFWIIIWEWIVSFCGHLGYIFRILQTLWDLTGAAFVVGFLLNFFIILATMSIYSIQKQHPAIFIFVLLPLSLYSLYFVNIILIPFVEVFSFRIFWSKTLFQKHQELFMRFLKVTPIGGKFQKEYFDMGRWLDFAYGILTIIFVIAFASQVFAENAALLIEGFVLFFAVGVPPIKYAFIILLYTLHSFCSCFNYCRIRFREIGDYSDPFLNSMYAREHSYQDLIDYIITYRNTRYTSATDNAENSDDNSITLDSMSEMFTKHDKKKTQSLTKIIFKAIFSRNTASIFVCFTLVIYMFVAFESKFTGSQAVLILVILLIIVPICTWMPMPFFWIRRSNDKPCTERILEEQRRDLTSTKDYHGYCENLVIWGTGTNTMIRWLSIVFTTITVIFVFFIFIVAVSFASFYEHNIEDVPDKNQSTSKRRTVADLQRIKQLNNLHIHGLDENGYLLNQNMHMNEGNDKKVTKDDQNFVREILRKSNFVGDVNPLQSAIGSLHRLTANPICSASVKGLDALQVISFAETAYYMDDEPNKLDSILSEFIGDDWKNYIEIVINNKTSFPHPTYGNYMRHFKVTMGNTKLILFAIRGTQTILDMLADAEMWLGSLVLDVIIPFVPFLKTYSTLGREYLGQLFALPRIVLHQFSLVDMYVGSFYRYIKDVPIPDDYDALILGHSLGGGISKILSILTGIQAAAVSGPGIRAVQGFYKSNFTQEAQASFFNINPEEDIVAMIDTGVTGSEFRIPCRAGLLLCHKVLRTLCQTAVLCGQEQHFEYCREVFANKTTFDRMLELIEPIRI